MYNETYLQHHGVLGMKWGVRRYQNKDGSLTPEGRKKYLKDDGQIKDKYTTALVGKVKKRYEKKIFTMSKKKYKELSSKNKKELHKTIDDHIQAIELNTDIKRLAEKSTQAFWRLRAIENYQEENELLDWHDLPSDMRKEADKNYKILNDASNEYTKRMDAVRKEFIPKYEDAILKDIGYTGDLEMGRKMVEYYSKGILTSIDDIAKNGDFEYETNHNYLFVWND